MGAFIPAGRRLRGAEGRDVDPLRKAAQRGDKEAFSPSMRPQYGEGSVAGGDRRIMRNNIDNVNKIKYNRNTKGRKGLKLWQARISISAWILT